MIESLLLAWSAWAPRLHANEDWTRWASAPCPLGSDEVAEARAVPAMLRRRCTPLSRAMLTAALACVDEAEAGAVRTVFASRHGSINESVELLENVARSERMSPARFTHTVHNAQSGLYSIAGANRQAASALAARTETFACGYLEALTHIEREPERATLLVVGDVPLSEAFATLVEEPDASYAVALLLAAPGYQAAPPLSGSLPGFPLRLGFAIEPHPAGDPAVADSTHERAAALRGWPDAAEFLRWLLGVERELTLAGFRRRWRWQRL